MSEKPTTRQMVDLQEPQNLWLNVKRKDLRSLIPPDKEAAFWAKVIKSPSCWVFSGSTRGGYGGFAVKTARGSWTSVPAHRVAYELLVGPIPDGLTLDHLCRNRACVNPAHLEAVTMRENVLRGIGPTAVNATKTHCKRGHELSGANLYMRDSEDPARRRQRACRACHYVRLALRQGCSPLPLASSTEAK